MPYHGKLHVMSCGLGGNQGDGVSDSGNTFTSSWYLSSPEQFLECIPGHYDPSEVDGCLVVDKRSGARSETRTRLPGAHVQGDAARRRDRSLS